MSIAPGTRAEQHDPLKPIAVNLVKRGAKADQDGMLLDADRHICQIAFPTKYVPVG